MVFDFINLNARGKAFTQGKWCIACLHTRDSLKNIRTGMKELCMKMPCRHVKVCSSSCLFLMFCVLGYRHLSWGFFDAG